MIGELKRRLKEHGGNVSSFAKKLGIHRTTLHKIFSGEKGVGEKVARSIGFKLVYTNGRTGFRAPARAVYS